jgi:hypothetical protein
MTSVYALPSQARYRLRPRSCRVFIVKPRGGVRPRGFRSDPPFWGAVFRTPRGAFLTAQAGALVLCSCGKLKGLRKTSQPNHEADEGLSQIRPIRKAPPTRFVGDRKMHIAPSLDEPFSSLASTHPSQCETFEAPYPGTESLLAFVAAQRQSHFLVLRFNVCLWHLVLMHFALLWLGAGRPRTALCAHGIAPSALDRQARQSSSRYACPYEC